MWTSIDFTNCKIDTSANYGGSDKKRGILYNGSRYMLKLSDAIPDEKRTELNSSYSNSAFSEYISCHILESMGFDVQETLLGTLTMPRRNPAQAAMGEKTYPAVACRNFVPEGYELVEFKFIGGVVLDVKPSKTPRIEDIYQVFTHKNEYFSEEFGKESLKRYWDTFIADALLGNFDRHANNWGYLVSKETGEICLAPVYDCGSCLYPQISDEAILRILESREEIQMRIDKFPTAALELEDGKKASYKQYISSFSNSDCTEALFRIAPRIDMDKICRIVNDTPGISDIRRQFYKTMLNERYQQVIMEPYLQHCREHIGQCSSSLRSSNCISRLNYCKRGEEQPKGKDVPGILGDGNGSREEHGIV